MVIDAKYKSLFVLPALLVTALVFLFALAAAVWGESGYVAWLGAAVASLPLPVLFARLRFRPRPRTSDNLPLYLSVAAIGVMTAVWQQFVEQKSDWPPTIAAIAVAGIFLVYILWFSRFGRFDSVHLAVGSQLPEFSLKSIDGDRFESRSLSGAPAIILFYRGNWCPMCMAQIAEIANRYRELEDMGIRVVLVSPQPDQYSRRLAARWNAPFMFLVDEGCEVASALGISIRNGVPFGVSGDYAPDTVLPTVVVCNRNGTILFSDQTDNYRVRPEPDVFLAILRRTGVVAG